MNLDRLVSKKYTLSLFAIILIAGLCVLSYVTGEDALKALVLIVITYVTGNVVQKALTKDDTQNPGN